MSVNKKCKCDEVGLCTLSDVLQTQILTQYINFHTHRKFQTGLVSLWQEGTNLLSRKYMVMFTLFPAGDGTTQHWFRTKIPGIFLHQVSDSVHRPYPVHTPHASGPNPEPSLLVKQSHDVKNPSNSAVFKCKFHRCWNETTMRRHQILTRIVSSSLQSY
jgi:hypothetical protein